MPANFLQRSRVGISGLAKAELLTLSSLATNYNSWNLLEHEHFSTFVKLFVDLTNLPFANEDSQNFFRTDCYGMVNGDPFFAFFP